MATINRLKSGSWRIRKMIDGVTYTMTVKKKPTNAEADRLLFIMSKEKKLVKKESFENVANIYIEMKSRILSPTTIREYKKMLRYIPDDLKEQSVSLITNKDIQLFINEYCVRRQPKTVRNMNGFISAVMKSADPQWSCHITLPQKRITETHMPEENEVRAILNYVEGTIYELYFSLAIFGLRRSEIMALTYGDFIDGDMLIINKALVQNENMDLVLKQTKTAESSRMIVISHKVAELAEKYKKEGKHTNSDRIYIYAPNRLGKKLNEAQKALGIEHFPLHGFRHYFASTASEIMPDAYVEAAGGWKKGSSVMKKVYDYAQKKKALEAQRKLASKII